ncbi:MAG: hypothetical protein FWG70_07000 [Oscillospiraceae bacterium]|nr:hypothetical protein [Oscillospiraceae bacterium]
MAKKFLTLTVAVIMALSLALTVSAEQQTLRLEEEDQVDGVAAIVYYLEFITADPSGSIDGNVYIGLGDNPDVQKSVANEGALFTEQGKDIFLDEGQASLKVELGGTFDSVGGYVDMNLWTVGDFWIDYYEFLDADGNLVATVKDGAVTLAVAETPVVDAPPPVVDAPPPVIDTPVPTPPVVQEDDKHDADTGLGDVAVASAIALMAAGAVVLSRKKK